MHWWLTAIRKFNRFELKYLISREAMVRLEEDLKHYVLPDTYNDSTGQYALSSLYYDTNDYRFYREKLDGLKFRRKLRIRIYETQNTLTDASIVYVEIKQRVNRVTQKRRVPMTYKEALALCNEGIIPDHDSRDAPVINEIYEMVIENNLKPSCITSYFRQAYFGTDYDTGLRITFDTNIRYRSQNLNLHEKDIGDYMISPDMVIMEVKVNERVPYRLTELIAHHNFRLIRVSKYCQWLETSAKVPRSVYTL